MGGDERPHLLDQPVTGALAHHPPGGQRRHPGVIAADEVAPGEALLEGVLLGPGRTGQAVAGVGVRSGLVAQIDGERVLAPDQRRLQTIAQFLQIARGQVQPAVLLDELLEVA